MDHFSPLDLFSLTPQSLAAGGMAALRFGGATLMLPVLSTLPWRGRIAVALVLGGALGALSHTSQVTWTLAGAVSEFLTGTSLGIGLRLTLSALQTAGTWIDEQTSTGLSAEQMLVDTDDNTLGTAQLLTWLGAWLMLTSVPWGADLSMLQRVIDSLAEIPLGQVITPSQFPEWSTGLLRTWSDLAIGVALPVCLLAGLMHAGMAIIGRALGVNLGQLMTPIRAAFTCLLLFFVLPQQAELIDRHLASDPVQIIHPPVGHRAPANGELTP